MFHMLTCLNLGADTTIEEFRRSLHRLTRHLKDRELLETTGPVGRRQRDTIMDTDNERDHEYYFLMSFRDHEQCDRAVAHIIQHEEPGDSIHRSVYALISDPIFICWEDIP